VISHTTAQFRKIFAELPAEVQRQARRAYRIFRQNPNHTSVRFSLSILPGPSTLFGLVLIIERLEFRKATKLSGTGSAHMQTTTNFFHHRGADPNHRFETDREKHPSAQPSR
jgi:hypothetical protein